MLLWSVALLHLLGAELVDFWFLRVAKGKEAPRYLRHTPILVGDAAERLGLVLVGAMSGSMPWFAAVEARPLLHRHLRLGTLPGAMLAAAVTTSDLSAANCLGFSS